MCVMDSNSVLWTGWALGGRRANDRSFATGAKVRWGNKEGTDGSGGCSGCNCQEAACKHRRFPHCNKEQPVFTLDTRRDVGRGEGGGGASKT